MVNHYALLVYLGNMTINDVPILYRTDVQTLLSTNMQDLLAYVRDEKWDEIKSERNRLETAGLPFKGSVLDYNLRSAFKLEVAQSAAKASIELGLIQPEDIVITWTMQDNSEMDLTYNDLLQIPIIAKAYSNELHSKGRIYREKIYSSTDIREIYQLKWE